MRVDDLRTFVAVAEAGSLARAAQQLGTAQPTISKSLARLERALRSPLVERHARGVRLTDAGVVLLVHARNVDLDVRDALAALRDLRQGQSGTVRIGVGVGIPQTLIAATCKPLLDSSNVSLEILGGMSDSLFHAVLSGDADFAITGVRPPGSARLKWTPLFHDPLVAVAHSTHPLVGARKVTWQALSQQQWIVPNVGTITRTWFEQQFVSRDLTPPSRVITLRGYPMTHELAVAISALLLVPASFGRALSGADFTEIGRPSDWTSERVVGVLARDGGHMSSAAAKAMEILIAAARRAFPETRGVLRK